MNLSAISTTLKSIRDSVFLQEWVSLTPSAEHTAGPALSWAALCWRQWWMLQCRWSQGMACPLPSPWHLDCCRSCWQSECKMRRWGRWQHHLLLCVIPYLFLRFQSSSSCDVHLRTLLWTVPPRMADAPTLPACRSLSLPILTTLATVFLLEPPA
jgi:hypothetical protein